jgi:hypothetical protein
MSDCRWIPTTATPSGSLNADGTINKAAFSSGSQAILLVGQGNYDRIGEAVVLDIIGKGEQAGDATSIAMDATIAVMQDNANGKWYALVTSKEGAEYGSYVGLFELKCGVALRWPFMVGGAVILGGLGLALGPKLVKGKKGATLGALVGILAAKLATPAYMKSAGLGALPRCPRGKIFDGYWYKDGLGKPRGCKPL